MAETSLRVLLLLLLGSALGGCVATSYVLSIGGRSTYAHEDKVGLKQKIPLEMEDAPLEAQAGHGMFTVGPAWKPDWTETVVLDVEDIQWDSPDLSDTRNAYYRTGRVELRVRGVPTQFKVTKYYDSLSLEHTYRHWYGYPAQPLLFAAVPLDAVILVVAFPVGVVYALTSD